MSAIRSTISIVIARLSSMSFRAQRGIYGLTVWVVRRFLAALRMTEKMLGKTPNTVRP